MKTRVAVAADLAISVADFAEEVPGGKTETQGAFRS
jgi:hypothetical protein